MSEELGKLSIAIDLDGTKLNKSLSEMKRNLKASQAQFKANSAGVDKYNKSIKQLEEEKKGLTKVLHDQATVMEKSKQQWEAAKKEQGENSIAAKNLETQYYKNVEAMKKTDAQLIKVNDQLANQPKALGKIGESLDKASQKFTNMGTSMKKMSQKFMPITKAAAKLTAGVALLATGVGVAAWKMADDFDKASNEIRVATGATGEDLEGLEDTFANVYKTVNADTNTVAKAIGNLSTYTGAAGDDLEDLTRTVLEASKTLGEDGVGNSQAFGQAMRQWSVPVTEGTSELDKLYKLTQDYGVGLGQITGHLNTYGSVLQNAGFTMGESADLMARLEGSGIAVSRVMPGLNASFRKWAGEGKNSREEFDKVIKKIKETKDGQEALTIATAAFGAEGAQRLTTAIKNGAIPSLDELGDAFENTEGLIQKTADETRTFAEKFEIMKKKVTTALVPVGDVLMQLAEEYMPAIEAAAARLAEKIAAIDWEKVIAQGREFAETVLVPLKDMIVKVVKWLSELDLNTWKWIGAIGATVAVVAPVLSVLGTLAVIIGKVIAVGKFLILVIMGITAPIAIAIAAIAAIIAIGILLYKNWDTIKEKAKIVTDYLKEKFSATFEALKIATDALKEAFTIAWQLIKDTIVGLVQALKKLVTGDFKGFFEEMSQINENLREGLSIIWGKIKEAIVAAAQAIWAFVKTIFFNMKEVIVQKQTEAKERLKAIWSAIVAATIGKLVEMINGIREKFQGMKESMVRRQTESRERLKAIWSEIVAATFGKLVELVKSVNEKFEDVKTGIKTKLNEAKEKVQSIWEEIKKVFSAENLKQIGKDVIQGLIDGMSAMAYKVWEKARAIAGSIKDAAKNILGINSPSRVLRDQVGKHVPTGIVAGIEASMPKLKKSVANMARATIPKLEAVTSFMRGSGGSNTTNNTRTNTNNVTINANDPFAMAREQERLMKRLQFAGGIPR